MIMRILTTLIFMLATVLPSWAATTWPAGTNTPNQTFYGNNNFLGYLRQGGVDVLTNVPGALSALSTNNGSGLTNLTSSALPAVLTNQVSAASFTDFLNVGTTVVISPTNGNLQSWVLTAASSASLDTANTNFTETLRLNIYGSNTLTWTTTTLSNATVLGPSNAISAMIFDHVRGTNLWWGYRLR